MNIVKQYKMRVRSYKMEYKEIKIEDIMDLVELYVETFNAPPWNDKWTIETASKRLESIIKSEGFYGFMAFQNETLCGLILGNEEQFFDGMLFNIKEFCVNNQLRGQGIGSQICIEFEKRLQLKGIKEIILWTSRNAQTEGFYQKQGFISDNKMVMMGKKL